MKTLLHDLKYGLRTLRKKPGFAAVATLTFALGIGTTTTLFAVLKALVLDPFPYPESERIVFVRSNPGQPLSAPDFRDIREQSTSFTELGVYTPWRLNVGLEKAESVHAIRCTAGVLRAMGIQPEHGRWLDETDELPGAAPAAVISHSLWLRSFAADPGILERPIRLDGRETRIVGVMPSEFEFASPWYEGHDSEAWIPLPLGSEPRGRHWLLGIGRLKDGVTIAEADAEVKAIGTRLAQAYPDTNFRKPFLVRSLWAEITRNTAAGMRTLFAAVAMLLLLACANVASMLLARGSQRQAEFSLRLALGASRLALVRLLLSETVLLGLLGSAVGILFALCGVAAFRNLIPARLINETRRAAIEIDGTVLFFCVTVALLSALLSGLLPALAAARTSVVGTLQESGRSQLGSRIRHRFLWQLVLSQIAIAVVLTNVGILFATSYLNVFKSNQVLDTERVISASIALRGDRYEDTGARLRFWDRLIERLQGSPGVLDVGVTTKLPLQNSSNSPYLVDDESYDPKLRRRSVEESWISPGYFAAMGMRFLRGRAPSRTDVHGNVVGVVINRTMAETCWPGVNPIGHRVRLNEPSPEMSAEVVGVVESVRQSNAERRPWPELYFPHAVDVPAEIYLIVHTSSDAGAVVPTLRQVLASMDSDVPLANVRTMHAVLLAASSQRRMSTGLINVFSGMALLLAGVGLYGTLSYTVSQRQREIGVRMALGAVRRNILHFVIRQAGLWVVAGLVVGLTLTGALSFVLRSLVFDISPWHPWSLLSGLGMVGGAVCLACVLPSLRATRVSPTDALRCE